jgi:hypothetical protein
VSTGVWLNTVSLVETHRKIESLLEITPLHGKALSAKGRLQLNNFFNAFIQTSLLHQFCSPTIQQEMKEQSSFFR